MNNKIEWIIKDFEYLNKIPYWYFKVNFNLHLPQLSLDEIYIKSDSINNINEIRKLEINQENISKIIKNLEPRLMNIMSSYNSLYKDDYLKTYEWTKLKFYEWEAYIIKDNEIFEKIEFWEVDPEKWLFIQDKLHYILKSRSDTLVHLWFTNTKWDIIAYCSFSILDRDYPIQAFNNELTKNEILNMTRAFAINNAPSNLMWSLFHKSYQFIKQKFWHIKYIMTYVNQNLEFEWSSFKWASYIPIWLSPMKYLYVNWEYKNRKGIKDWEIAKENKLFVLPIVLLARWTSSKNQLKIEKSSDYVMEIDQKSYKKW